METGNYLPKNGYGWIWGIFYRKIRIWMDVDPAEWGGVEWVSEFCPVKGSSRRAYCCCGAGAPLLDADQARPGPSGNNAVSGGRRAGRRQGGVVPLLENDPGGSL